MPDSVAAIPAGVTGGHHRLLPLDGMRAVAVMLVFATHTALAWHGWEGVHLFFVLSGFLITRILRESRHSPHFWSSFYIKRAARILPPLLVCFGLLIALVRPKVGPLMGYVFFGANFMENTRFALGRGFDVLWSLAVEEHFYLLWPFAVRFCTRKQLIWIAGAICALSPLLRLICRPMFAGFQPIYELTPFQLDGLAAGSLLALLQEDHAASERLGRFSGAVFYGLAPMYLLLSLWWKPFWLKSNSAIFASIGYSMIVATAFALLAHVTLRPQSFVARLLSWRPLVFLGAISYGMYLFHKPMIALANMALLAHFGRPRMQIAWIAGLAITVVFSWMSFHFYEKRVMAAGRKLSAHRSVPPSPPLPAA